MSRCYPIISPLQSYQSPLNPTKVLLKPLRNPFLWPIKSNITIVSPLRPILNPILNPIKSPLNNGIHISFMGFNISLINGLWAINTIINHH